MPYTPANTSVYQAAYQGYYNAVAGSSLANGQAPTSPNALVPIAAAALAYAQALDTLYAAASLPVSSVYLGCVQFCSIMAFRDRSPEPTPVSPAQFQNAAAGVIVAIQEAVSGLAAAGVATSAVPNLVQTVITSAIPAANKITLTAPNITRQGSGKFRISSGACPYPTGAPSTIEAAVARDGVALGPQSEPLVSGPGGHTMLPVNYVDTVTDYLPHVYSIVETPGAGQIADDANHQWITVREEN